MSADQHRAEARVATPAASRYLQQLCKHFAHKIPETTFNETIGRIPFSLGVCDLDAGAAPETLLLTVVAADGDSLQRLQEVVASHLLRFAFREPLAVAWVSA